MKMKKKMEKSTNLFNTHAHSSQSHVLRAPNRFTGLTEDYDDWEREMNAYLKDATTNERDRLAVIKNALGGAELAVLQSHIDWFYAKMRSYNIILPRTQCNC
jgi:hypothetical protein